MVTINVDSAKLPAELPAFQDKYYCKLPTMYFAMTGLDQRGPNRAKRAACGPRTVFVRPANSFCMPRLPNPLPSILF